MLVSLSILGLIFALALSIQGPWMARTRQIEASSQFWSGLGGARTTLDDLTTAAIDPEATLRISGAEAQFRAMAPRLAHEAIDVKLEIQDDTQLLLTAHGDTAILLRGGPKLRLRRETASNETAGAAALLVDAQVRDRWTPLMRLPLGANAPLSCAFDLISRDCR